MVVTAGRVVAQFAGPEVGTAYRRGMGEAPIHGHCDAAFIAVRDAFAENFSERGEVGAGLAVVADGIEVVRLHGGWVDEARTRSWEADTLVNFYSVGKA